MKFKDDKGREWSLALTIGKAARVLEATKFDLLNKPMEAIEEMGKNGFLFFDVAWAIVEKDADKAGVTQEQFLDSFSGDCVSGAQDAFLEALTSFSPSPSMREMLGQIRTKVKELQGKFHEEAKKRVSKGFSELDVDQMVQQLLTPGTPSGNSPASSASAPATSSP